VDQHVLEQLKHREVEARVAHLVPDAVERREAGCPVLTAIFHEQYHLNTQRDGQDKSGASSMDTMAMWLGSSFEALGAAVVSKMQGWPAGSNCSTLAALPGVAPGATTRNSKRSEAGSAISSMP
jgi:hypothetical protein